MTFPIRPLALSMLVVYAGFKGYHPHAAAADHPSAFLGFDRNQYPGDTSLKELRKTFSYAGYWLNNPPGAKTNTWAGKHAKLEAAGFGFLALFNGRLYRELAANASQLGASDATAAVAAARREGFPAQTIIFLDQEEGGRLLPEQKAYLFAWSDGVSQAGFRAGVYCSGLEAREQGGNTVITAEDIWQNAGKRSIAYWVTNDACPPSPGCSARGMPPLPRASGVDFAEVWQFAQSPKRKDVAASCRGYHADGNCYASAGTEQHMPLDLNAATSPDPSHGRTRSRSSLFVSAGRFFARRRDYRVGGPSTPPAVASQIGRLMDRSSVQGTHRFAGELPNPF
jgi:hypothetical protein